MNVTQDLSILHLILQASAVVQLVMALLAGVWVWLRLPETLDPANRQAMLQANAAKVRPLYNAAVKK